MKGEYCGNTILCVAYTPFSPFSTASGSNLMKLKEVAGGLVAFYCGGDYKPYQYNHVIRVQYFSLCEFVQEFNNNTRF